MKANHTHRGIAKAVDFILAGGCSALGFFGVLLGVLYLAISDGLMDGRSFGKRIVGLRVKVVEPGPAHACSFRESMLRNALFSVLVLLVHIPFVGIVLFGAVAILVIAAETYFVIFDEEGVRIGDILGGTRVVNEDRPQS